MNRRSATIATGILVLGLLGCGSKTTAIPAGELVVQIESDLALPRDLDRVHVVVTQKGRTLLDQQAELGAGHLTIPAQFRIATQDRTTPVSIRGLAFKEGVARIERSAITQVPPSRNGLVRIAFNYLCDGTATQEGTSTCGDGKTCKQGSCRTTNIPVAELPVYEPAGSDGGVTMAGGLGNCFDALACFAAATSASLEPVTCTVPIPSGADVARVNVALQLPAGGTGVCDDKGCWVVIDQGPEGWSVDGDRIRLPEGVCLPRPGGSMPVVALTTSCAVKTPALPPCGSWSSAPTPLETPPPPQRGDNACGGGPLMRACGNCGMQTRQCNNGNLTDWSPCSGEGECAVGTPRSCGMGGMQSCGVDCRWGACTGQICEGPTTRACGNCGTQARTCNNGVWSEWQACKEEGVCAPNATEACGQGGHRSCGGSCQWGECAGQTCEGPATRACGNCGTQSRACTNGAWSDWSACSGQGACTPNAMESCAGGTRSCGGSCQWSACTAQICPGAASEACGSCGTRTRTCDPMNGQWSTWSTCTGEGPCMPGSTRSCGNKGTQTCGGNCQWDAACTGQVCDGAPTAGCGNCGTMSRTCDPNTGMWSSWSSCLNQGACMPGATTTCGSSGTRTCKGSCQWDDVCSSQTCLPPGPTMMTCGNCGTQTRSCDTTTGVWSGWSACTGEGACTPNATQSCGAGGTQSCTNACQWSSCVLPCVGPSSQTCGNCGMQTRTCDMTTGNWSAWGACMGQGVCMPGATQMCGLNGMQSCTNACQWSSCVLPCVGPSSQTCGNCGTQTRTCDMTTGNWSAWGTCMGQGVCMPGATQTCGTTGSQSCSNACQWSQCVIPCQGSSSQACGNCGTQTRTCDTTTGTWSAWGTCTGQGACTPGATQTCGSAGGSQSCGTACQWSSCTCVGPTSQSCGHCGTQTRTCNDGVFSQWGTCMAEKPVPPGGPPGGFTFDMGNNPGWTIDGVYDGDKSTQLATVSGPLTWDDLNQVSKPINGDPPGDNIGSARLMSSGGSTFTASSGYWRVDAISPDLADTSPFQNHTGVSFWVLNKFGGLGSVITQAIFQVEKCDGTTSYFREVNSSGVVFCTAAYNTWTHCVFNITVNNTNRIKRLYLRFFFQSGVPYEGLVNIDSITAQ